MKPQSGIPEHVMVAGALITGADEGPTCSVTVMPDTVTVLPNFEQAYLDAKGTLVVMWGSRVSRRE